MSEIRFNRWSHQSGTGGIYQDSSGNIGIGTSTPTSVLDIQGGSIKIGNDLLTSSGVSTFTSGLNVTGGSVGIGTDNPRTKLDVRGGNWSNGDIVVGQIGNAGRINFRRGVDGSDAAYLGYDGATNNSQVALAVNSGDGTILFKTNSTERLRIKSDGNIGIGTNNPGLPLDVVADSSSETVRFRGYSTGDQSGTLRFTSNDGATIYSSIQSRSTFFRLGSSPDIPVIINANNKEIVRVEDNSVHIGERTGNNNTTNFGTSRVTICGPAGIGTTVTKANSYLAIGNNESTLNGVYPITFGYTTNSNVYQPAYIAYKTINSGAAEYGDLIFGTRNVITDTLPSERLRITHDGQINISALDGTLRNPSLTNIQRNGLIIFPSSSNGYSDYSDNHMFSIAQSQGNWLSGETDTIHSSWGPLWTYHNGSGTYQKRAGIQYDHASSEQFKFWSSYGDIVFKTDNARSGNETAETCDTEALRIKYNGKVGIGTDNPFASALTVHGGIKVHGYDYTRAYTGSSHQPAAILDPLDPAQTGEGSGANQGWFSMGWSTTARSGEVMHRNTESRYYLPGGSTAHGYYIEAGTGEAGGICLDEDSVNVYGSSDTGATFRIIDKDADIVVAEMQQSSWDWEVRGNVNSSSSDLSTISDRRLKIGITTENTVGILSAYSNLQLKSFIRIDSYDFIKNRYEDQEELREVGLIAQEVEEVFPDCVSTKAIFDKRSYSQVEEYLGYELDEIKRVKMGKITFKSIEAIQELIRENNQLKTQLSSLEARIAALEG